MTLKGNSYSGIYLQILFTNSFIPLTTYLLTFFISIRSNSVLFIAFNLSAYTLSKKTILPFFRISKISSALVL